MIKSKHKKNRRNLEFQEIYGLHSVLAALNNPKRKHYSIYILEKYRDLLKKYQNKISKIHVISNKEMSKLFGYEVVNQGILLKTSSLSEKKFQEILVNLKLIKTSIIVALDHVTDPNNIGSIMRSCSLFNCSNIIVNKNHCPEITPSLTKAASGALEKVNYIKVVNLKRSLNDLKKIGFWVYGLDSSSEINNNKYLDLPKKCVIVLGSEGKGIREINKKVCDKLIAIPSTPNKIFKIDSLNVSNACTIALYDHFINNSN